MKHISFTQALSMKCSTYSAFMHLAGSSFTTTFHITIYGNLLSITTFVFVIFTHNLEIWIPAGNNILHLLFAKRILSRNTTRNYQVNFSASTRVSHENMFLMKKIGSTRSASIWGLLWRNPKGFLILTTFRGCTRHFRFDLFYIVDFHSTLILPDRMRAEWKSTM